MGKRSDKIILFDVDDTLIHTTANIWVMKDGNIVKKISNSQYNDYMLEQGEYFDYTEFDDPHILSKEKFTRYWDTLKREYLKGTHIGILTARGSINLIRNFMLNNGIDIKKELIFAIDDPILSLKGDIYIKKSEVVKLLYYRGYREFIFFDDNINNLLSVKKLENDIDVKIIIVKV